MASYARRSYKGAAAATTISSGINASDTTFSLSATTGWPDGSGGDFMVSLDRGLAGEEKILCSSRSGFTVTVSGGVAGRGIDDTSAASHASGATVEHVLGARDADEANYGVSQTVGKVTTKGDELLALGANTLARHAAPANDRTRIADSSQTDGWTDYAIPLGEIGYAGATAANTGVSTITDLTGAAVTVTAKTSRKLKITAQCAVLKNATAGLVTLSIREGSSVLEKAEVTVGVSAQGFIKMETRLAAITGSHTYKVSLTCATGTVSSVRDSDTEPHILVEDMGA